MKGRSGLLECLVCLASDQKIWDCHFKNLKHCRQKNSYLNWRFFSKLLWSFTLLNESGFTMFLLLININLVFNYSFYKSHYQVLFEEDIHKLTGNQSQMALPSLLKRNCDEVLWLGMGGGILLFLSAHCFSSFHFNLFSIPTPLKPSNPDQDLMIFD